MRVKKPKRNLNFFSFVVLVLIITVVGGILSNNSFFQEIGAKFPTIKTAIHTTFAINNFVLTAQAQTPPPPPSKDGKEKEKPQEDIEEGKQDSTSSDPSKVNKPLQKPIPSKVSKKKKNFFENLIDQIKSIFIKDKRVPQSEKKIVQKSSPVKKENSSVNTPAPPSPTPKSKADENLPPPPEKQTSGQAPSVAQKDVVKPPPPSKVNKSTPEIVPPPQDSNVQQQDNIQAEDDIGAMNKPVFRYNDGGRRDPFINLLEGSGVDDGGMSNLDVGSLKLVGIIDLGSALVAMLEDTEKNTIFLSEGDSVNNGMVTLVTVEEIVFEIVDVDNQVIEIKRRLRENKNKEMGD